MAGAEEDREDAAEVIETAYLEWYTAPPVLRHAKNGTVCPGPYCEECMSQWLLTGNLYYTRDARPGQASCWECSTPFSDGEGYGDMFCCQGCADAFKAGLGA